jgi:hypothetical protein
VSIVTSVIFRGKLPNRQALSRKLVELGFPFKIAACVGSLERQDGYMPMWLRREDTGVEFDVTNDPDRTEIDEMAEIAGQSVDPAFDRIANFRWAGDTREMAAGLCTAAALANLVDGVVFEDQEGKLFTPDEAIKVARVHLQPLLKWMDSGQPGTSKADVRHYLRSLLKQRSDLVLIGRLLLVRPVRHVMRGVYFERTADKCQFQIWPYLKPLCGGNPQGLGFRNSIHDGKWHVWLPHFQDLLMDVLAQDILGPLGKITTLDGLAAALPDPGLQSMRVLAFVLAGERERAVAYVDEVEQRAGDSDRIRSWVEGERKRLERDINEVCAEAHATEAQTARALKLQDAWEPSPFRVELPHVEGIERSADPLFVPQPWPSQPLLLYQRLPDETGDIRFAKDWLVREGETILVAPLSRDQAEERHQQGENYLLTTRMAEGLFLMLHRQGTDRRDPDRLDYPRARPIDYAGDLVLTLQALHVVIRVSFDKNYDVKGMVGFSSASVQELATRQVIWRWDAYRYSDKKVICDNRGSKEVEMKEPMTEAAWDRLTIPRPSFAEFEGLVEMVSDIFRAEGYGEIV